jgi:hypothetical protein
MTKLLRQTAIEPSFGWQDVGSPSASLLQMNSMKRVGSAHRQTTLTFLSKFDTEPEHMKWNKIIKINYSNILSILLLQEACRLDSHFPSSVHDFGKSG